MTSDIENDIQDMEGRASQADAVQIREIVNAASQHTVFGYHFLDVEALFDAQQPVGGWLAAIDRIGNGTVAA